MQTGDVNATPRGKGEKDREWPHVLIEACTMTWRGGRCGVCRRAEPVSIRTTRSYIRDAEKLHRNLAYVLRY